MSIYNLFNSNINKLNIFIILSCIFFIEIFHYIQNNIFIFNDLSKGISNHKLIKKIFFNIKEQKSNM